MMYFRDRGHENLEKMFVQGVGKYNIPQMQPIKIKGPFNMIRINEARHFPYAKDVGIQFYTYDYQIMRLWNQADSYIEMLQKFRFCLSPDFSVYTDFPLAVNIYNCYRKHWLGAYWQSKGIKVIPTISWAGTDSYDYCFDGDPKNSVVSVSSVGTQNDRTASRLFLLGFCQMMRVLEPTRVVFYGDVPPELRHEKIIVPVEPFQKMMRQFDENKQLKRKAKRHDNAGNDNRM